MFGWFFVFLDMKKRNKPFKNKPTLTTFDTITIETGDESSTNAQIQPQAMAETGLFEADTLSI